MASDTMRRRTNALAAIGLAATLIVLAFQRSRPPDELPGRIPQAAPYDVAEAESFAPPFEPLWESVHNPGRCSTCHSRIFAEWNGSMMSNAWRDPGWRGAFLLVARQTSTAGNCDVPNPPDGSERARLNPFANRDCTSSFDAGRSRETLGRPGSLLDGFCAQCHMPANYVDNVPLSTVTQDAGSDREHGALDPAFHPTADNGTGIAFATLAIQMRNTDAGKRGVFCAVCHTIAGTREMPYGNYHQSDRPSSSRHQPPGRDGARTASAAIAAVEDRPEVADPTARSLGYAIGAGAYRLSPRAIASAEYWGPLAAKAPRSTSDRYVSGVFGARLPFQQAAFASHQGHYQALHERAEMCSTCHDVTNPLAIRNRLGHWVGGFPIERTYTEWANSRYADRPGNANFDPRFKRDCQTCHMQQDFGQPGTAQTLYAHGSPRPPLAGVTANDGPRRPAVFSHHFVGGNTYVPRVLGAGLDGDGGVERYPELSTYSFSSASEKSVYHNAYWMNVSARGPVTQHARLAWDRLRNVLDLDLSGPRVASPGGRAPLRVVVTNSGSGHDFPSGFPEGRVAWIAVRAFDLATGRELPIHDSRWNRDSLGVGYLTDSDRQDPNFPRCRWTLPAGSPDPYAVQLKAVASLGDGCPTLELAYASPLNLVTNSSGIPVDETGKTIDRSNLQGMPRFRDLDGDGEVFDDAYLVDSRLRPLPHRDATRDLTRYSVVIPAATRGPVAVTAAVYYQSFEAVVAKKFLGNLADLDTDFKLEPCVLRGACNGRTPSAEPAVVEGAPPVPMEVRSWVIDVAGAAVDRTPPAIATYPAPGARDVYRDVVVKAIFSEPVIGVDERSFTLTDPEGRRVPAFVDQIGDGTWALFPHRVFGEAGKTYTAHLAAGVCDFHRNCTDRELSWSFTLAADRDHERGDTTVPIGFPPNEPAAPATPPCVRSASRLPNGTIEIDFSTPVMNVNAGTVQVEKEETAGGGCARPGAAVAGATVPSAAGDRWVWRPASPLTPGARYCIAVSRGIFDLGGRGLAQEIRRPLP